MIYDINNIYYYIAINCEIPERVIMNLKSRGCYIPKYYYSGGDGYTADD